MDIVHVITTEMHVPGTLRTSVTVLICVSCLVSKTNAHLKLYSEIVTEADFLLKPHGLDDLVALSNKLQQTVSFIKMLFYTNRPVQHNSRP